MNRLLACLSVIIAVLLVAASIVSPAAAQSKSVEVLRRDAEITILPNGDVQVTETWEVQFNGGPFTSAFRSIPLNKVTSIDSWGVADETHQYQQVNKGSDKQPYTFEYSSGDGFMKATWFFPPTTDQTRTFGVFYILHGALRIDPAGDQFYWKFIEADRGYTINSSDVTLHLPAEFNSSQLKFTPYQNGAAQAGAKMVNAQTLEFTGGPFAGGVEWEIRAQFPHGVVIARAPAWQTNENQLPTPNPRPVTSSRQSQAPAASQSNSDFLTIVLFLIGLGVMAILQLTGHGNFFSGSSSSSFNDRDSGGSSGGDRDGGGDRGGDGGGGGSSGFS